MRDGKGGSSASRKALWAAHVGSGKSTSLARAFQRSALLGCSSAKRLSSSSSMHRKGLERARQRGERGRGGGDAGGTRARAVGPRSGTASLTGSWAAWEGVQDSTAACYARAARCTWSAPSQSRRTTPPQGRIATLPSPRSQRSAISPPASRGARGSRRLKR